MEQYPIPQFIEQEGKIIFFLTFRQFFILVGGTAICMATYFLTPFPVFIFSVLIIIPIALALAFAKINNEPVFKFFLHFLGFSIGKKNYTWKKKEASYPLKTSLNEQINTETKFNPPKMQTSTMDNKKQ